MKLITAILRPDSLDAVHDALDPNEARVMSASVVMDDCYKIARYRGIEMRQPRPRFRVEVVVLNDLAVPDAIGAIERAAIVAGAESAFVVVTTLDDVVRLPRVPTSSTVS
jgi:nitrogen regulatory protein PII